VSRSKKAIMVEAVISQLSEVRALTADRNHQINIGELDSLTITTIAGLLWRYTTIKPAQLTIVETDRPPMSDELETVAWVPVERNSKEAEND